MSRAAVYSIMRFSAVTLCRTSAIYCFEVAWFDSSCWPDVLSCDWIEPLLFGPSCKNSLQASVVIPSYTMSGDRSHNVVTEDHARQHNRNVLGPLKLKLTQFFRRGHVASDCRLSSLQIQTF